MWRVTSGIYLILLIWLLILAGYRTDISVEHNYFPGRSFGKLYGSGSYEDIRFLLIHTVGNVLIFLPFPFVIQSFSGRKMKRKWLWLLCFCFPVLIEFFQRILDRGTFNIDDILLNIAGIVIGLFLMKRFRNFLPRFSSDEPSS